MEAEMKVKEVFLTVSVTVDSLLANLAMDWLQMKGWDEAEVFPSVKTMRAQMIVALLIQALHQVTQTASPSCLLRILVLAQSLLVLELLQVW